MKMDFDKIIITKLLSMFVVHSPKGRNDKIFERPSYALSFTNDGQITYTHRKKSFISDNFSAVILPKGQTYDIKGDKEGFFPVINFECENFSADTFTLFPIKNMNVVKKDYELLKNAFFSGKNNLHTMGLFYNLLSGIINQGREESKLLSPAINYIEENYSSEISNLYLAKLCHISEEHFRKQFKKAYGISPYQYIINLRISKAKQLLSEGYLKISAVSEQCGFFNLYHFCRLFKQKTGLTPSEYMKQNKISAP